MKRKLFDSDFGRYCGQFQLGLSFAIHCHNCDEKTGKEYYHSHIWIDLGIYFIEFSFFKEIEQ